MNYIKRFLSLVLIFTMLVGCVPCQTGVIIDKRYVEKSRKPMQEWRVENGDLTVDWYNVSYPEEFWFTIEWYEDDEKKTTEIKVSEEDYYQYDIGTLYSN